MRVAACCAIVLSRNAVARSHGVPLSAIDHPQAKYAAMRFDKPPIDELVIGIVFNRLNALRLPHLGSYWDRICDEFPKCEQMAPLVRGPDQAMPVDIEANVPLPMPMVPRIWFVSEDDQSLLQVQSDRFIGNWRKRQSTPGYPGFDIVFANFLRHWNGFQKWLSDKGLGTILATEVELAYINLFYEEEDWGAVSDIAKIIHWAGIPPDPYRNTADRLGFFGEYALPTASGALRVSLQQGIRKQTSSITVSQRVFVLNMTATRRIEIGEDWDEDWFQAAHDDLRDFFAASLTPDAVKRWGRADA